MCEFAEVAARLERISGRLDKAAELGAFFGPLSNEDLVLAARYFAGMIFPMRDQRTTRVGGAALLSAIAACVGDGAGTAPLEAALARLGDLGDVAEEALAAAGRLKGCRLRLREAQSSFEALAETPGARRKVDAVVSLLELCSAREARFVVKLISGDLRIGLKEGQVEDALARLYGAEVARIQWANMLTGDIGEAAVLARWGKLDTARLKLFHAIKFMLASPTDPAGKAGEIREAMPAGFAVEDKFDGIRAQVHVAPEGAAARAPQGRPGEREKPHGVVHEGMRVAIFSRTLGEITSEYPDLIPSLAQVACRKGPVILDGEIVPTLDGGILPFQELQKRLGRKTLTPELLATVSVTFQAFDVLYARGKVLIDKPFALRRSVLESMPLSDESERDPARRARRARSMRLTDPALLDEEFDRARARGNEGLMIKNLAAPYKPGRRDKDWLKVKRALATLDVVVTSVEAGNGRRRHLLSDFTFAVRASSEDPRLLDLGKAYSGLTDEELGRLTEWFKAHTKQELAHGRVRVVEPRVVLEVTFDRVQASSRHKAGYALRFPRVLRLREDKGADEIDTLETVKELARDRPSRAAGGRR